MCEIEIFFSFDNSHITLDEYDSYSSAVIFTGDKAAYRF